MTLTNLDTSSFDTQGDPVYATMITGKSLHRAGWAMLALENFRLQTYRNRYLVVVNDGDFDLDLDAARLPPDRVISIRPSQRHSLGELRNIALDAIPNGALWVFWDDDDWRHPRLMTAQHRVLTELGVAGCFMASQVKYAFGIDAAFEHGNPGGFAGTLMAYNDPAQRFPDLARGEDSVFADALKRTKRWYLWRNPPHYYFRFIHGANTCDEAHFKLHRQTPGKWRVSPEAAAWLNRLLPLCPVSSGATRDPRGE